MTAGQKWQYFKDYYLFHALLVAFATALALFLFWHFLKPREDYALYVSVIDESLDHLKKNSFRPSVKKH